MWKNILIVHLLVFSFILKSFGQSLNFNAANNSHVNLTNDAALHLSAFTLEAWVKPVGAGITTTSGSGGITAVPIITKGRSEADAPANINVNYLLGIDVNKKLTADFEQGSGTNRPVVGITSIPNNVWTHVAATYDPVSAVWKLYINGVLDLTKDLGSNITPANTSIQPAAIATAFTSTGVANGYFDGNIDEARIWNVVRTDAEILNNYKQELTSGTGLVARYGLNEGSGTTAANSISATSNGTLVNNPQWSDGFTIDNSDLTPPTVLTINRQSPATNPTSATSVTYRVTFSEKVTGVNIADFAATRVLGSVSGTVSTVTSITEATYDVTVSSITGEGDLRLDLNPTGTGITDLAGNAINGGFTSGQTYTIQAASSVNQSLTFNGSNNYVSFGIADSSTRTQSLNLTTFTLEAWVKKEGTGIAATSGSGGITAYPVITKGMAEADAPSNLNMNYFLGVDQNGRLTADFEQSSGTNRPVVGATPIPDSVWTHVAVTYEPVSAVWKLYINGVLDNTKDLGSNIIPVSTSIQHAGIASALNSKGVPFGYFAGKIDEVRIWNIARTGTDILNSYKAELTNATGLIARWGLNEISGTTISNSIAGSTNGTFYGAGPTLAKGFSLPPDVPANPSPANNTYISGSSTTLCLTVSDPEKKQLRVRYYGRKKKASTGKLTIVLVPDTQFYTAQKNGGTNSMFKSQTTWIANNRASKNIVYVGQLGDCVDHGDTYEIEWKRADTAMRTIENAALTGLVEGIPYGVSVGNHDQSPNGDPKGTTSLYNKYFGSSRFTGRSYYGGHNSTSNDNHYQLFSAGGTDFLLISFEFDQTSAFNATGGALDWGEDLVKAYPDRKVIVMSHYVLSITATFSTQGSYIFNRLKQYPNVILIVGGHVTDGEGESRRADTYNSNTIHTMTSDYQSRTNGGNGLLRILEFDPQSDDLAVKTYSPFTNTFETDATSQFNLNVNLNNNYRVIGEVSSASSGSNPCVNWPLLEENADYEWYAEIFDEDNKITTPTWSFTTKSATASRAINNKNYIEQKPDIRAQTINDRLFTLYPNPNSTQELTILFNKPERGLVMVEVMDVLGHVQIKQVFRNVGTTLNLKHMLTSGTYSVKVQTADRIETQKLIVVK